MSTAYKCDRCGKLYEGFLPRFETADRAYHYIEIINDGSSKVLDLCPDCIRAFEDFINNRTAETEKEENTK